MPTDDGSEERFVDSLRGPIRIDVEQGMTWNRETNVMAMKTVAHIRELPDGPRKVGRLLWGPLSIPDNPDASWPEILRAVADLIDDAYARVPSHAD